MKRLCMAFALLIPMTALGADEPKDVTDRFKITTKKAEDTVTVSAEKTKTVFNVKSPQGISRAIIERLDKKWPDVVVVRMHMKGLEQFQAGNGKMTVNATVSSTKQEPRVRVWIDEKKPLDAKSPLYLNVQPMDDEGYIEITFPKAFFDGNPKQITLNWIDYFRN